MDTNEEADTVSHMVEVKKERRPRRSYTEEFKAGAVRLVLEEGKTTSQVARDLDLTLSALRTWVEQARANSGKGKPGALTSAERRKTSPCPVVTGPSIS